MFLKAIIASCFIFFLGCASVPVREPVLPVATVPIAVEPVEGLESSVDISAETTFVKKQTVMIEKRTVFFIFPASKLCLSFLFWGDRSIIANSTRAFQGKTRLKPSFSEKRVFIRRYQRLELRSQTSGGIQRCMSKKSLLRKEDREQATLEGGVTPLRRLTRVLQQIPKNCSLFIYLFFCSCMN